MHTIESPVAESDLKSKIKYETLNTLSENGRTSFFISMFNAILVYFTLREAAEPIVLNLWLLAIVLTSLLRLMMVVLFLRLSESHKRLNLWTAVYLLFVYASAACWGALPLWDLFYFADWTETLIVFVIAGMSAGGLVTLYPKLLAAIPYLLIILLPLIFELAISGKPAHTTMAILASMFLILLVRSTYVLNASAAKSIRLEMENSELFQFLLRTRS